MNKIKRFAYQITETMFSDSFQAKGIIGVFGTLGVAALIGSFWNPWQLATSGICLLMVLCGISELKAEKNEN